MHVPPRPKPSRGVLEGRYARLEPLDLRHAAELFFASTGTGADERHRYLFDSPPIDLEGMQAWIAPRASSEDPLFYAVIDRSTGRVEGRQSYLRITPDHGVIEIGHILWGPAISRTRVATEAQFLMAQYAFDELGYRRYEWKCDNANEKSKRAALRFGFTFEGVFRQHMWIKGQNRDTAWFAMIDVEWPRIKTEYARWLDPANFDANGVQLTRLGAALTHR